MQAGEREVEGVDAELKHPILVLDGLQSRRSGYLSARIQSPKEDTPARSLDQSAQTRHQWPQFPHR